MNLTRKQFISALIAPILAPFLSFLPKRVPTLDELNLVTLREFGGKALADNFFMNSPLLSHLRDGWNLKQPFDYEVMNIHPPSPAEVEWLI